MSAPGIVIAPATTTLDIAAAADLVREYVYRLGRDHHLDISYQDFAGEMATFPARYEALFLARVDDASAGVIALKRLTDTDCEMKRLYCRDAFRGLGLGARLAERLIAEARTRGYSVMRLDTHIDLTHAIGLYERLGFAPSEPHNEPDSDAIRYFARAI